MKLKINASKIFDKLSFSFLTTILLNKVEDKKPGIKKTKIFNASYVLGNFFTLSLVIDILLYIMRLTPVSPARTHSANQTLLKQIIDSESLTRFSKLNASASSGNCGYGAETEDLPAGQAGKHQTQQNTKPAIKNKTPKKFLSLCFVPHSYFH